MIPEEEKIIICSLMAASDACGAAAAGYRLMGEHGKAERCDRVAARHKDEAMELLTNPGTLGPLAAAGINVEDHSLRR